jgi:hypothetical protein
MVVLKIKKQDYVREKNYEIKDVQTVLEKIKKQGYVRKKHLRDI